MTFNLEAAAVMQRVLVLEGEAAATQTYGSGIDPAFQDRSSMPDARQDCGDCFSINSTNIPPNRSPAAPLPGVAV
jgi:hypothetical protein